MSLDHTAGFVKSITSTCDDFLDGKLRILQPAKGFRAGIDSILLGASVAPDSSELLDLGCGVGVAALTALVHQKKLSATLVERDEQSVHLAGENLTANALAERGRVLSLDVTAKGQVREAAGLKQNIFTSVIANPPYFDARAGTAAAGASRAMARHMDVDQIDAWVTTAASSAASGGEVIFIFRADGLAPLLAAFEKRFGAVRLLPIASRAGEKASRILLRGIKGSRGQSELLSPLILHGETGGEFLPEIDAIFRGNGCVHW